MARLIDADKLKEHLDRKYSFGIDLKFMLFDEIDNQPTAYDIDKVVEELEKNSVMRANSKTFYDNPQNGKYVDEVVLLNKAIEIVKAGVVDV